MRKQIGYKMGYRIQITNGFFEVVDGRRVVHYGKCRKRSTIQEIANKTILLEEDKASGTNRRKEAERIIGKRIS